MTTGTQVRIVGDRYAEREGRIGVVTGRTHDGSLVVVRMRGTDGIERIMTFTPAELKEVTT